jgi:hypothetical protein
MDDIKDNMFFFIDSIVNNLSTRLLKCKYIRYFVIHFYHLKLFPYCICWYPKCGLHVLLFEAHTCIPVFRITRLRAQALVSFKKYMPPPLPYFKVNICPLPLPHFAMKNPAQTGSGCIRFIDWKIENATFAEYSCPIRLRGARYLYLNVAVIE